MTNGFEPIPATSRGIWDLIFWRAIVGLGLGGEWSAGATLLRRTVARAAALKDVAGIVTVTHRDLLARTVDELAGGGPSLRYIAEPLGRNTAPAVAVAALEASLVWGSIRTGRRRSRPSR